jgi:nucleotide-binding universal stress UspA family protein
MQVALEMALELRESAPHYPECGARRRLAGFVAAARRPTTMSMGTILVHLEEQPGLDSVLATALLAARRFGAHITGLHVRPGMPRLVPVAPEGAFIPATEIVEDLERADREQSRRLRDSFEAFMREHGVAVGRGVLAGEQPVADWHEEVSPGTEVLGSRGRVFDLIVVGRPVAGAAAPSMSALETALFESGRPILIAPPGTPQALGSSIAVAWNGSTETARTIALAMPFLAQAEQVLVVSVEEGMVPGPSGQEVAQNLVRNRIAARSRHIQAGGRPVGGALLEEAAAAGADLLLKGAYTHSRLRQMIFGGATSHILGAAEIPVIMAH